MSASMNFTAPFAKSAVINAEDPNFDFYQEYLADPEFHLPAGQWQTLARAAFDTGGTCTATPTELSVSITLTVEGPSEPAPVPSEQAEPSPSSLEPSSSG
jgi:hypothetical protein